jgi:hypothetical protein
MKEKTLIEDLPDGGIRFQGEIPEVGGGKHFDRTTLTPMEDQKVRQVIEVSKDGKKWRTVFDAIYVKK